MKTNYLILNEVFKKGMLYRVEVTGPYDGCMYEPTYGYCFEDGQVDFIAYGDPAKWSYRMRAAVDVAWANFDKNLTGTFDLNDNGAEQLFAQNPQHAVGMAKMIAKNHDLILEVKCPDCGLDLPLMDFEADPNAYHGDGGVGIIMTSYVCSTCLWDGTCEECHSYVGTSDITDVDGRKICTECRIPNCLCCKGPCDDNDESRESSICDFCRESDDGAIAYLAALEQHKKELAIFEHDKELQVSFPGCEEIKPPAAPDPDKYII